MRAVLMADDDIDIPHLLEDLRRKLGIAACDGNDGIRMRAADAAHHLARFPVTDAGDRAGIDDIDIRVITLCRAVPVPDEKGTHRVTVILVHLAAKCDEGHGFLL